MIKNCPACGCVIYQNNITRAHKTFVECLQALEVENKYLQERTRRVMKLAEDKVKSNHKEVEFEWSARRPSW